MWDPLEESLECNECTGDLTISPPIFNIPPPPIPPDLQNFMKCNQEEELLHIRLSNWNNDMCDAMPALDTRNFLSSPYAQTLALVGVFSIVLVLVIIITVIYIRRIILRRRHNCTQLKNLMQKHSVHSNHHHSKMNLHKFQLENHYEECNHCNNYTLQSREARDFIGYTTIDYHNASNSKEHEYSKKFHTSRSTQSGRIIRNKIMEPDIHYSSYDLSNFHNSHHKNESRQRLYNLSSRDTQLYCESSFQLDQQTCHQQTEQNHHNQQQQQQQQPEHQQHQNHEYSMPYELFNNYHSNRNSFRRQRQSKHNNKKKYKIGRTNSADSSSTSSNLSNINNRNRGSGSGDSGIDGIGNILQQDTGQTVPEYAEIELVVPNLVIK